MTYPRRDGGRGAPPTDCESAVVLGGWGVRPPGVAVGSGRMSLDLWRVSGGRRYSGVIHAWRRHEGHLRALAARWDWTPSHYVRPANAYGLRLIVGEPEPGASGPYFFAEACLLAGPQVAGAGEE